MCGIVGQVNRAEPVKRKVFDVMVDSLRDRGPDGRGSIFLSENCVALGHRRLSIIDLSDAGRQPMSNGDGKLWLTFNGEIYNYLSLRRDLEQRGYKFKSHTDSEVIIHAYDEWGVNCVNKLRGIFAFGIYDCKSGELFLARDHIGVKPLYYYHNKTTFVFASQPKAIVRADGFRAQVDPEAFSLYLAFGNVPADKAIYQGVNKLLPGCRLLLRDGAIEISRYWSLLYEPQMRSRQEARTIIAKTVKECVLAHSISDVAIGTLLSGGVDSTILTSILSSSNPKLDTFTIGFEEQESDERKFAKQVASTYQTNHREGLLNYQTAISMLPAIVEAYDEPFHPNGTFPMYALSRLVQENDRKVVLGGDGADELFAGYLWYPAFAANSHPPLTRLSLLKRSLGGLGGVSDTNKSPVEIFFRYNGFLSGSEQRDWVGPAISQFLYDGRDPLWPLYRHWHPEYPPVLAAQFMDFHCFLTDHCLCKVDRASMACGVEVRVPLLDPELVSLVFTIQHSDVYSGGERKGLFKEAMQSCLPKGLDTHRKKGFSSPMSAWQKRGLGDAGRKLLLNGSLCAKGLLNGDSINRKYSGSGPNVQLLLLGAELWARRWMEMDPNSTKTFVNSIS